MSLRPLKDFMETNKILTGDICILISGFNKPKCVSNKSACHNLYLTTIKGIQNALITGDWFVVIKLA